MQLFVQLNMATLPEKFRKESGMTKGILQMFYCTNLKGECEYTQAVKNSTLRIKLLRIIDPDKVSPSPSPVPEGQYPPLAITGWRQVDDYPHLEDLAGEGMKLREDEEEAYEKARVTYEGEKLGGWPYWVQGEEYPPCPDCGKPMRFIFQIDSGKNIPYIWGDMGMGHITWCPVHRDRLQFTWACY